MKLRIVAWRALERSLKPDSVDIWSKRCSSLGGRESLTLATVDSFSSPDILDIAGLCFLLGWAPFATLTSGNVVSTAARPTRYVFLFDLVLFLARVMVFLGMRHAVDVD